MIGQREAGRVMELCRVHVAANLQLPVASSLNVGIPIVNGLQGKQFWKKLVRNEKERGILVEDMRIARTVFRLQ